MDGGFGRHTPTDPKEQLGYMLPRMTGTDKYEAEFFVDFLVACKIQYSRERRNNLQIKSGVQAMI